MQRSSGPLPADNRHGTSRRRLHFNQGDYDAALADLDAAMERAPELAIARIYRGVTYMALGRCTDGRAELDMLGDAAKRSAQVAEAERQARLVMGGCLEKTF